MVFLSCSRCFLVFSWGVLLFFGGFLGVSGGFWWFLVVSGGFLGVSTSKPCS